jgi:ubiquinone biosynthesis protein UbiJ
LAEAIGEVPAHLITTSLHSSVVWGKSLTGSFKQDLEEFIKYELRLLPSRAMAVAQFEAIDQLRLATDRLEARFKNLVKQKAKRDPSCQN